MQSAEHLETRLKEFLDTVIREGNLDLTYTFVRATGAQRDFENPDLIVNLEGGDADLLLAGGAELLRSLELLAHEALRIHPEEHERVVFDCRNRRMLRLSELTQVARLAAEKVVKTGMPYEFPPMNSRERRIIHLAVRDVAGIRSESEGVGPRRHVVLQSLKPAKPAAGGKAYQRL